MDPGGQDKSAQGNNPDHHSVSLADPWGGKLATAKAKGMDPWSAMEKWWTTIGDMAFPIMINDGDFTFTADGVAKVIPYKGMTCT